MDGVDAARQAVRNRMPQLWSLLEEWVLVDSHTADHDGCDRMADALSAGFALEGLEVRRVPGQDAAGHVIATTPAWSSGGGTNPSSVITTRSIRPAPLRACAARTAHSADRACST